MRTVDALDQATAVNFSIAVVDADPRLRTMIAMQLGEAQAASFPSLEAADSRTAPGTPLVIVLGPSLADEDGLAELSRLARSRSSTAAVLVAQELSTTLLTPAMRSGVS